MCDQCGKWCILDDYYGDDADFPIYKDTKMAEKDYVISGGYYFSTEQDAIDNAKKRVAKNMDDVRVYKAIKIVSTTTPNVEVKDLASA